ncbi:MAG: sigma 54-interacting transcriptional regulator [Desulfobacterales bacterium]|nr:sigma 54-interacting transcriptional regulator [Desulfobacterales bacterium]
MDIDKFDDIDIYRVLDFLHEGVVISDITGKIVFFNEAQGKIDDFTREETIGRKIIDVYKLDEKTSPTMRCLNTGEPIINETLVYRTRFGRVSNIISNVYPLYKGGTLIGAINFSKDYQILEKIMESDAKEEKKSRTGNGTRFSFKDIIASDPDMLNAIHIAKMASGSPSPIMISGETGTGKELFAQSVHNHSHRKKKPFIPVNCAAIPEHLLEGILFGTSKGSFTGAIDKRGLFEQADGGTIFLDELDSMPLTLQAKLLRVIQEKKVRKLGSLVEKALDVKIISSVSKPPLDIIQTGALRMDLFYRMGVVSILLPPLRERKGGFNALVTAFIKKFNTALDETVSGVSDRVSRLFAQYHWPGNVRELEHIIEAAMNMVGGEKVIRLTHLPPHIFAFAGNRGETGQGSYGTGGGEEGRQSGSRPGRGSVDHVPGTTLADTQALNEKQMICNALKRSKGNAAKAARQLGVSPQSFHYKLKKYKVDRKAYADPSK